MYSWSEGRLRLPLRTTSFSESAAPESVSPAGSEAGPAAPAAAGPGDSALPELLYDVRGNLTLHCSLPNEASLAYFWTKNGTALEQVWEMTGRYVLEKGGAEMRMARALEDDYGNYTCGLTGRSDTQSWAVRGRPHLKLPANTNVVEGQRLKLVCKVIGKPYRPVSWWYSNSSDGEGNFTEVTAALGPRAVIGSGEGGAPGAVLTVEAAARSDAGRYRCSAPDAALPATTTLRVKDMYAALWPFLGICAEVFVLCAIILVYEKRRTKPELDDSDTDNHDQ
ncbi:unnamed protein product [Danaus chrysippus]|uniref:(African queen) hypothetical protein n=1 Tax=Danaus chrysippus TaxID=151541 RepID=A0A8J2QJG5_9NEOP|nr:unnamed protein product [Danaus chrysippus]